jgi:hypothetical protein
LISATVGGTSGLNVTTLTTSPKKKQNRSLGTVADHYARVLEDRRGANKSRAVVCCFYHPAEPYAAQVEPPAKDFTKVQKQRITDYQSSSSSSTQTERERTLQRGLWEATETVSTRIISRLESIERHVTKYSLKNKSHRWGNGDVGEREDRFERTVSRIEAARGHVAALIAELIAYPTAEG